MVALKSHPLRLLAMTAVVSWAMLLSLETLFRPGGISDHRGLPQHLLRQGDRFMRRPPVADSGQLSDGLVLLEAADYAAPGAARLIRLRRISLLSSGTGVRMPVEDIGPALVGAGARGRCVVLDTSGAIVAEQATAAAWQGWIDSQRRNPAETLAWLAGLRPFRANTCLWESHP